MYMGIQKDMTFIWEGSSEKQLDNTHEILRYFIKKAMISM